jgi:hypothetical protein
MVVGPWKFKVDWSQEKDKFDEIVFVCVYFVT